MAARPWLAAWAGGVVGTAAMTAGLMTESRLRNNSDGPVDYDLSDHVVAAACAALRKPAPRSAARRRWIFYLIHWGYGSAAALQFEAIRRRTGDERTAAVVFFLLCQLGAFTMFPALGGTPWPWQWKRELLLSSLVMHAIYVMVVVPSSRRLRDASISER